MIFLLYIKLNTYSHLSQNGENGNMTLSFEGTEKCISGKNAVSRFGLDEPRKERLS